ncbi:alpha/beta fold hydrolase [Luteolibacter marinus]|uniref:alpha/beta fold hydrolase n=1 Tax=Luteolibacter marinus TaxID=2776705 RepID=UPI0018666720|nr:alpha/beta fold hydrolase [Luteolibacter marinus]
MPARNSLVGCLGIFLFALVGVIQLATGKELEIDQIERFSEIVLDSDRDAVGDIYVLVKGSQFSEEDREVIKYSRSGERIWTRSTGMSSALRIHLTARNEIVVAGDGASNDPGLGKKDICISKFSSEMSLLWRRYFGSKGDDFLGGITSDTNGYIYFGGIVSSPVYSRRDCAVGKISNSGSQVWIRRLMNSEGSNNGQINAVAVTSDSSVVVAGYTSQTPSGSSVGRYLAGFIARFSHSGALENFRADPSQGSATVLHSVQVDSVGNIIVGGVTTNAEGRQAVVEKFSPGFEVIWSSAFAVQFNGTTTAATVVNIQIDRRDRVLALAIRENAGQAVYSLRRYDPSGSLEDESVVSLGSKAAAIGLGPLGSLVVSGSSSAESISGEEPFPGGGGYLVFYNTNSISPLEVIQTVREPDPEVHVTLEELQEPDPFVETGLKQWNGSAFDGDLSSFDPADPVILFVHGWNSSPNVFNALAGEVLAGSPDLNILAWDWSDKAGTGVGITLARSRTPHQASELAAALADLVGPAYGDHVHFVGHSLGALIVGESIDMLVEREGLDAVPIQASLMDDASITNATQIPLASSVGSVFADPTSRYSFNENYVSIVGALQSDAVNVFLPEGAILGAVGWHSYPIEWYRMSAEAWRTGASAGSDSPGYHAALRLGGTIPSSPQYHIQTFSVSDEPVLLQGSTREEIIQFRDAARVFSVGASIGLFLSDQVWGAVGKVQASMENGDRAIQDLKIVLEENSPAYTWVPVSVPEEAVGLAFDFRVSDFGDRDFLSFGIGNELLFALEGEFMQDGEVYNSGVFDIARFTGQDIELFIALNSDDSSGASVVVDNISFMLSAPTAYDRWADALGLTKGYNDGLEDDPNGDGIENILHFANDSDPLGTGGNEGKRRSSVQLIGGERFFTLTLPVRAGLAFEEGIEMVSQPIDGVSYKFFADGGLSAAPQLGLLRADPPLDSGLPPLRDIDGDGFSDWEYLTIRILDPVEDAKTGFIWSEVVGE